MAGKVKHFCCYFPSVATNSSLFATDPTRASKISNFSTGGMAVHLVSNCTKIFLHSDFSCAFQNLTFECVEKQSNQTLQITWHIDRTTQHITVLLSWAIRPVRCCIAAHSNCSPIYVRQLLQAACRPLCAVNKPAGLAVLCIVYSNPFPYLQSATVTDRSTKQRVPTAQVAPAEPALDLLLRMRTTNSAFVCSLPHLVEQYRSIDLNQAVCV